jgi:hypothetical protein
MTALLLAAAVNLSFSMRGDRARGWPVKTKIAIESSAGTKELLIDAGDARKPVSLQVPAGTVRLTIAAQHHRLFTKTLEVDKDLSLPEIALSAIPAISGRVIARQRNAEIALAGAQILAGGKQLATTDENGLFHVDLPEDPTPAAITIVHAGQAPKVVPLYENLAAENELGTIELPRGVTLTLELDRRYDDPKPLTISVIGKLTSASREVKPSESEVDFSGLAPGVHQIIIKGTQPLEWMTDTAEVKETDLEQKEIIAPFRLDGRVSVGNEGLRGGGTAEIAGPSNTWRAALPIDEDGRFGGIMWQTGKVSASLKTSLSPTPVVETSPELGSDPSAWNIVLKRRAIVGHIFDAETKDPVANARVEVVMTAGDRRAESTAEVAKDGGYSIRAIQNGRYDVRVTSAEHADARKSVPLGPDDETPTVDFPLEGGVEAEVWVVWASGQPIPGARVISEDGRVRTADQDGRAVLRLHVRETRFVTVVPPQGSFATAEVTAPRSGSAKVQVVVPPPVGSIRIRSPLPGPIVINYKNRSLPEAVFQYLRSDSGEPGVMRLVHLPAGDYGIFSRGARWVNVRLDGGEQSVEIVPIPMRRPAK